MSIQNTDATPRKLHYFDSFNELEQLDPELDLKISAQNADQIAEIFKTPLTGSYNWDYSLQDDRIKQLYELGKELNWNANTDIDWSQAMEEVSEENFSLIQPFHDYGPFKSLSDKDKEVFRKHLFSWTMSQFLHGEQGALLVASQLCSCAPTHNAKLYAASQTFDEARHVEAFSRYIKDRVGLRYPISNELKSILDKILEDDRWDLKFVGMQILIEGLALSSFNAIKAISPDPVLRDLLGLVIRDEARHVAFGINYLEKFIKALPEQEIEDRAQFAYEACVISRERLIPLDVFQFWGWDVEEARKVYLDGAVVSSFRNLLFARVIPNLKRTGLLTESVRPKFEELGILEYENLASDGDIDWAELEKPLETVRNSEVLNDDVAQHKVPS